MSLESGVHHLALNTKNMKEQIEFFTDVLGAELKALYWMHGTNGVRHCFLRLDHDSYVSFVQGPQTEGAEVADGKAKSQAGAMGHVAFSVSGMDEMMRLRDRIRDRGHIVLGPIDHGFCHSMYFGGPEGLALEICVNTRKEIDERAWIDPECVAVHGITPQELERYKNPKAYQDKGGKVAQPSAENQKYATMFGARTAQVAYLPEDELTKMMGGSDAPVKVGTKAAAE